MIGALLGASFLIGMIAGWLVIPALAVAGLIYWTSGLFSARLLLFALIVAILGVLRAPESPLEQLDPTIGSFEYGEVRVDGGVVDDGTRQRFRIHTQSGDRVCVDTYSREDIGRNDQLTLTFEADSPDEMSQGRDLGWRHRNAAGAAGSVG